MKVGREEESEKEEERKKEEIRPGERVACEGWER